MAWVEFNVNEYIRIKLTERGREILRGRHADLFAGSNDPVHEYREPAEDADGWVEMQAWVVMQEFGPSIVMGLEVPFETTIRFSVKDPLPTPPEEA